MTDDADEEDGSATDGRSLQPASSRPLHRRVARRVEPAAEEDAEAA